MRRLFICLTALLLAAPLKSEEAAAPPPLRDDIPFRVGETAKFRLKWTTIPVGYATAEVLPMTEHNGEPVWHFRLEIRTNSFADRIFRVRDQLDSYVAEDLSRSVHFTKRQREGNRRRNVVLTFDWDANTVQYATQSGPRGPVELQPGTFDELGFFYIFRRFQLDRGMNATLPITDGRRYVPGTARVVRRERVTISGKAYDAWLLDPDLSGLGGVFEGERNADVKLWITADERAVPLKITGNLRIGSFSAELMSYQRGTGELPEVLSTEADDREPAGGAAANALRQALPGFLGGGNR